MTTPCRHHFGLMEFGRLLMLGGACVLAGCGDSSDDSAPVQVERPAAGGSRWAAVEADFDGDGLADLIMRYEYDVSGLRTKESIFNATAGVSASEPREESRWQYDAEFRVIAQTRRLPAADIESTTSYFYGADGRLASSRSVHLKSGSAPSETSYLWRNGRLVQSTTGGPNPKVTAVAYGADGLVSRVDFQPNCSKCSYPNDHRFFWRSDGQLGRAELHSGKLDIYALYYDTEGRHVRTEYTDDGFEKYAARLFYDSHGRVTLLEKDSFPNSFDEAAFKVDFSYRYRWEKGPCQAVFLPQLPPEFDPQLAAQASSMNISFGCAP